MKLHFTPWVLAFACSAASAAPAVDYEIRATTDTGLMASLPTFANLMRGISKPRGDYVYNLQLELNGTPQPDGATHTLPDAMKMTSPLQLLAPQRLAPVPNSGDSSSPDNKADTIQPQRPQGRMVLYWGCNADANSNQPQIIDFATMSQTDMMAFAKHVMPLTQRMASANLFGQTQLGSALKWPNAQYTADVPLNASLVGTHSVKTFSGPEFTMDVDASQDFLAPLKLKQDSNGVISWDAIPRATGYFGLAFGRGEQQGDMVIWTSSAKAETGGILADYQNPAEAADDIARQTVLAPDTTQCALPAALTKGGNKPMVFWVAYGPEKIQSGNSKGKSWRAHLRVKSTATLIPGVQNGANSGTANGGSGGTGSTGSASGANATPSSPSNTMVNQVKGKLKGLFGF